MPTLKPKGQMYLTAHFFGISVIVMSVLCAKVEHSQVEVYLHNKMPCILRWQKVVQSLPHLLQFTWKPQKHSRHSFIFPMSIMKQFLHITVTNTQPMLHKNPVLSDKTDVKMYELLNNIQISRLNESNLDSCCFFF